MDTRTALDARQRALVEDNVDLIPAAARRVSADPDAASHAGLALVQLAAAYDPGTGVPFRAYARQLLPARTLDAWRRDQARQLAATLNDHHDPADQVDTAGSALDTVEREQLLATLVDAWLALPAPHRRAVERMYAGLDRPASSTTRRRRDAALAATIAVLAAAAGIGRPPRQLVTAAAGR